MRRIDKDNGDKKNKNHLEKKNKKSLLLVIPPIDLRMRHLLNCIDNKKTNY